MTQQNWFARQKARIDTAENAESLGQMIKSGEAAMLGALMVLFVAAAERYGIPSQRLFLVRFYAAIVILAVLGVASTKTLFFARSSRKAFHTRRGIAQVVGIVFTVFAHRLLAPIQAAGLLYLAPVSTIYFGGRYGEPPTSQQRWWCYFAAVGAVVMAFADLNVELSHLLGGLACVVVALISATYQAYKNREARFDPLTGELVKESKTTIMYRPTLPAAVVVTVWYWIDKRPMQEVPWFPWEWDAFGWTFAAFATGVTFLSMVTTVMSISASKRCSSAKLAVFSYVQLPVQFTLAFSWLDKPPITHPLQVLGLGMIFYAAWRLAKLATAPQPQAPIAKVIAAKARISTIPPAPAVPAVEIDVEVTAETPPAPAPRSSPTSSPPPAPPSAIFSTDGMLLEEEEMPVYWDEESPSPDSKSDTPGNGEPDDEL